MGPQCPRASDRRNTWWARLIALRPRQWCFVSRRTVVQEARCPSCVPSRLRPSTTSSSPGSIFVSYANAAFSGGPVREAPVSATKAKPAARRPAWFVYRRKALLPPRRPTRQWRALEGLPLESREHGRRPSVGRTDLRASRRVDGGCRRVTAHSRRYVEALGVCFSLAKGYVCHGPKDELKLPRVRPAQA